MQINPHAIKPYGDTLGDGAVQVSFSLPMPASPEAREAARRLAQAMGLDEVDVTHMQDLGEGFSFFVLYGKLRHSVDTTGLKVARVEAAPMSLDEVNAFVRERIGRAVVVVGACTGSDAHTVGLDAIMNMKGYHGHYGLERYSELRAYNLGSQVPNEDLIAKAVEVQADALLVSQVVTQKDVHVKNLTALVELLEAEGLRQRFLLIVGGPRITAELALELGFDAGFGPGTLPSEVAAYIAQTVARRLAATSAASPGGR